MTRDEVLRAMTKLHDDWIEKAAERVSVDPADIAPGKSDYNEHHADVSASGPIQDPLNAALVSLISNFKIELR